MIYLITYILNTGSSFGRDGIIVDKSALEATLRTIIR